MHSKITKPMTMALLLLPILLPVGSDWHHIYPSYPTSNVRHPPCRSFQRSQRIISSLFLPSIIHYDKINDQCRCSSEDIQPSVDVLQDLHPLYKPGLHYYELNLLVYGLTKSKQVNTAVLYYLLLSLMPSVTFATDLLKPTPMDTSPTETPPAEVSPTAPAAAPDPNNTQTPMDTETQKAIVSDTDPISSSPNMHVVDLIDKWPDDQKALAMKPYLALFGEGDDFLHDSLAFLKRTVMKVLLKTDTLDESQLKLTLEVGPTFEQWILAIAEFATNQAGLTMLSKEEFHAACMIIMRLSYTPPQALFKVTRSTIENSHASRAWRAASDLAGSWYAETKRRKDKAERAEKRQKLKERTQKQMTMLDCFQQPSQPNTANLVSPDGKNSAKRPSSDTTTNTTTNTTSPKQPSTQTSTNHMAADVLVGNVREIRVSFRVQFKAVEKESYDMTVRKKLVELFTTYQGTDKFFGILPWRKQAYTKLPVIITPEAILKMSLVEFRAYTDRFSPAPEKDCWFKMAFTHTMDTQHFLSSDESNHSSWFVENKCAAFMVVVQDSSESMILGEFLYSGHFIDTRRLHRCIQASSSRPLRFGCRTRKNLDLVDKSQEARKQDWIMSDSQLISVEVDVADERELKAVMHAGFNSTKDPKQRPGGYNIRFLPDKKASSTGSIGTAVRYSSLRKHASVIKSLTLIKSYDLKHLDKAATINGHVYTLRQVLQELTYPLVPEDDVSPRPLFHTMDVASSGKDIDRVAYFTAYHDQSDVAERLVAILPAYIDKMVSSTAAKEWFHASSITSLSSVDFIYDDAGNWTGTWATPEDILMQDILDEDMGVEAVHLDGLEAIERSMVSLTADDASVHTFGAALGADNQQTGSGSLAGLATAAVTGRSGQAD